MEKLDYKRGGAGEEEFCGEVNLLKLIITIVDFHRVQQLSLIDDKIEKRKR